jgi:hypothetical protein
MSAPHAMPTAAADGQPVRKRIGSARRGIQWDENNLDANAEWHRENPVTMHIDEPKTPYNYDDGEYPVDSDDDEAQAGTWADASYNHLAAKSRHEAPVTGADPKAHRAEAAATTDATDAAEAGQPAPRPKLTLALDPAPAPAGAPGEAPTGGESPEKQQDRAVFNHMRKAVYADEGKKFLAMRNALANVDDEEDEEDAAAAAAAAAAKSR